MWWSGNKSSGEAASFVFRRVAGFAENRLRRLSICLNKKVELLTIKQKKALLILFVFVFGSAGIICAIPGIHILPASGIPLLQSSLPPVFPSETMAASRFSKVDSLRAYSFSRMLDSMRTTKEGLKEIEAFESQHPGLLDSMLQISNSLYPEIK